MIGRIALVGVGYVLGAKAGRGRYDAIARTASQLATRLEAYAQDRGLPTPSTDDVLSTSASR